MPEPGLAFLRRTLGRCLLASTVAVGAAVGMAGCAQLGKTPAVASARVDRLAALFEQTLPLGWMVERVAAQEPNWPFQGHMDRFTPAQLACTRSELTAPKVAVTQHKDASGFAQRHPDQVEDAIRLLEGGAAEATGVIMRAGVIERSGGPAADLPALMGKMSAAQLRGFMELQQDPRHAELRQAMRLDGIAGASSRQESHQRGRQTGQAMLIGPLLSALERCGIAPASLLGDSKAGTPT